MVIETFLEKADRLSCEAAKAFSALSDFLKSGPDLSAEDAKDQLWELQNSALLAAEEFKEHYDGGIDGGGG